MVTTDLGACEWFVWDLRRSGLIDRGQLDQIVGEFLKQNPRAEPPALAEYLVGQGILTAFQAERMLQGKTQGLVLGPYVLMDAIGPGSMGRSTRPARRTTTTRTRSRCCRGGACGTSAWPAARSGRSAVQPPGRRAVRGRRHRRRPALPGLAARRGDDARSGRRSRRASCRRTWRLCTQLQIAQGLDAAHQNSLFHGLLKPSNIMIGPDGQVRILDFGIGSLLAENEGESLVDTMSTANTLTSGLDCASPESIMEPTNRTPAGDQYSLGCVLYYCLTGRVPFPGRDRGREDDGPPDQGAEPIRELRPGRARGAGRGGRKLMAKKPEERFGGCDEVVEAPGAVPWRRAIPRNTATAVPVSSRAAEYGGRDRFRGIGHRMPGFPASVRPDRLLHMQAAGSHAAALAIDDSTRQPHPEPFRGSQARRVTNRAAMNLPPRPMRLPTANYRRRCKPSGRLLTAKAAPCHRRAAPRRVEPPRPRRPASQPSRFPPPREFRPPDPPLPLRPPRTRPVGPIRRRLPPFPARALALLAWSRLRCF